MLKTVSLKTVTKSSEEVGVYTYSVETTIENDSLISVNCFVTKKGKRVVPTEQGLTEIDDFIQTGKLTLIGGVKSASDFSQNEDVTSHFAQFEAYIKELTPAPKVEEIKRKEE